MDPFTTQALADLKDLLVQKVITLAERRTEVAALHDRALAGRAAPVAVQPPAVDFYDETMAHIAFEKKESLPARVPSRLLLLRP